MNTYIVYTHYSWLDVGRYKVILPPPRTVSSILQIQFQDKKRNRRDSPGGGGVHNMLRVQVCATHMGGFLGPKFSEQGSLFWQIFHKHRWVMEKLAKNSEKCQNSRQNSS